MGSNDVAAHVYDRVVRILSKHPSSRTDLEIQQILSWFRKKSDLFRQLKNEIVADIIKNCDFQKVERDNVIIKQGERGECFFIILSGTVAIHINTNFNPDDEIKKRKSKEEEEDNNSEEESGDDENKEEKEKESAKKAEPLDRSVFGNYVGKIDAGRSFGELALINADCVRNATIIADETTDLVVVNRDLYNRSLHAFQAKDFEERKSFVENNALFSNWQHKYKKQMAMSLRKEKVCFDSIIVRQGLQVDGLTFLLSGQVKILTDPAMHCVQYPDYFPLADPEDLEKVQARESLRRELSMPAPRTDDSRFQDKRRSPLKTPMVSPSVNRNKSKSTQAHRNMEVCNLGALEIIGDLEAVLGLHSYAYSVVCTQQAEIYVLDQKNHDRLIEKRNPKVIDMLRESVIEKYNLIFSWVQSKEIPLIRYFLYKLSDDERRKKEKLSLRASDRAATNDWTVNNLIKGPIIDMFGPGSVFYTIRMKEKQRQQEKERYQGAKKRLQFRSRMARPPAPTRTLTYSTSSVFVTNAGLSATLDDGEYKENNDILNHVGDEDGSPRQSRLICHQARDKSSLSAQSNSTASDFKDAECGDDALNSLEERIAAWHSSLNDEPAAKRNNTKRTVKLHRFVHESTSPQPLPGKKVLMRPKARKRIDFVETMKTIKNTLQEDDGVPSMYSRQATNVRNFDIPDFVPKSESSADGPQHKKQRRPLSSRSWFKSPTLISTKRPKSARQYTAEDYEALKEELRQRQRALKSLLLRPQSAFM